VIDPTRSPTSLPAVSATRTLDVASAPISFADTWLRSASFRTSAATTAKPRPCSPARAASIAAFSASTVACSSMYSAHCTLKSSYCLRSSLDEMSGW